MSKDYNFSATDGETIQVTYYEAVSKSEDCIIFVHGFKGFKEWGFVPYLAKKFASENFHVITFNFSHNGIEENPIEFTRLDKFAQNTFSREVRELNEIVDAVKRKEFTKTEIKHIGLLGHSRGGAIAILTANRNKNINALSVWSSVSKLDRYSEAQKVKWREKGVFEVLNMRTKQVMSLNISLLDDIEKNGDNLLNIQNCVETLSQPLLIIHGDQDLAVPYSEAEKIFEWSDKSKSKLVKINNTGHTFNCVHPFNGSNEKFEEVINHTLEFYKKQINYS